MTLTDRSRCANWSNGRASYWGVLDGLMLADSAVSYNNTLSSECGPFQTSGIVSSHLKPLSLMLGHSRGKSCEVLRLLLLEAYCISHRSRVYGVVIRTILEGLHFEITNLKLRNIDVPSAEAGSQRFHSLLCRACLRLHQPKGFSIRYFFRYQKFSPWGCHKLGPVSVPGACFVWFVLRDNPEQEGLRPGIYFMKMSLNVKPQYSQNCSTRSKNKKLYVKPRYSQWYPTWSNKCTWLSEVVESLEIFCCFEKLLIDFWNGIYCIRIEICRHDFCNQFNPYPFANLRLFFRCDSFGSFWWNLINCSIVLVGSCSWGAGSYPGSFHWLHHWTDQGEDPRDRRPEFVII